MIQKTALDHWLFWTLPWLAPTIATLLAWQLSPVLPTANFAMLYLAGVLLTAMSTRVRPALVCALLSFLAYNFFHTAPHFSFFMVHQEDILTAGLFVLVAVVTGQLAARLREKVLSLEESNRWNQRQIEMARELATCVEARQIIAALERQIAHHFALPVAGFFRAAPGDAFEPVTGGVPAPSAQAAPMDAPPTEDLDMEGDQHLRVAEAGNSLHVLLGDQGSCLAGVTLRPGAPLSAWQRKQLEALVGLVRLAWERVRLGEILRQETLVKEREQLRSALLSSISHDLRTPLATMIGSVSSLLDLHDALTPAQQQELLTNTLSEARRLDRYIQKLLDMTRLGHGELTLDRAWVGVDDILSAVMKRARPLAGHAVLRIETLPELPLLYVHPALIEQALFNVLENAIRYAPADSAVTIRVFATDSALCIDVHDQGPGVAAASWDSIFDMFFTLSHGDQHPAGTGLGLAICQGILGAHGGGAAVVQSGPETGTTIRLTLPKGEPFERDAHHDTHSDH